MPTRPPGMDVGGGRPQGPHLCPDHPVCPILSQKAAGQTACPWERQSSWAGEEAAISPTSSHPPGPVGSFSPSGPFRLLKSSHGLSLSAPFLASELRRPSVGASHTSHVSDLKELPTHCPLSQGRNWAPRGPVTARVHTERGWQGRPTPGLGLAPGGVTALFFHTSLQERKSSPFFLESWAPNAQLHTGGPMPTRWPGALPVGGSSICQDCSGPSPAIWVWKFFQERCLESGQQVFSTAVEISNDGIMRTSHGPSPTPLYYEKTTPWRPGRGRAD